MKKALAIVLTLALVLSLGVSAFADIYVEGYFDHPEGYETKEEGTPSVRLVHKDPVVYHERVFACFDSLKDAFSNVRYVEQHDELYLYESDDSVLMFPLEMLGQDFYMIIEKDSGVEFTGKVVALPYYAVAAIEDCAEEINLDPEKFDVTHYMVVAFATPEGEVTVFEPEEEPEEPIPSPEVETKTVYAGSVTVDKTFGIFPGKNVTVRWMVPTGPNEDGTYDMPGVQVIYSDWNDDHNIIVGNPAVANVEEVEPGVGVEAEKGNTDVNVDLGTAEIPAEQQNPEVSVDVNDGTSETDVLVGGENPPEAPVTVSHTDNTMEILFSILEYLINQ